MKQKNKKVDLKGEQLGTLGATLLKNMLADKEVKAKIPGSKANIPWQRVIRVGEESGTGFLMPPHPLTNFEIPKYYQK